MFCLNLGTLLDIFGYILVFASWTYRDVSVLTGWAYLAVSLCLWFEHTRVHVPVIPLLTQLVVCLYVLIVWVLLPSLCFCQPATVKTRAPQNVPLQFPIHTDQEYVIQRLLFFSDFIQAMSASLQI